jgi:CheY-like chemotaxis protein
MLKPSPLLARLRLPSDHGCVATFLTVTEVYWKGSEMATKVLIADDNKPMADVVKLVLTREDYDVRVVHDGLSAIRAAKEWKPDIILLDVMMPQMNGFEVCRRLRQYEATAATPILLLTAKSSSEV